MPLVSTFSAASVRGWSSVSENFWSPSQIISASDGTSNDFFGNDVIIDNTNTYMAVTASNDLTSGRAGSVYIFVNSGTTWSQTQKITPPSASTSFGWSLAMSSSGNYLVITDLNSGPSGGGGAWIYTRSGSTYTFQAFVTGSDTAAGNSLGYSCAINSTGDYLVLGAPGATIGAFTNAGAAYVFLRTGGSWAQQQKINASDRNTNDRFGESVAINDLGNAVTAGAPNQDTGGSNAGAAYFYSRSGTVWTQRSKFQPVGIAAGDLFGGGMYISNNGQYLIVSAIGDSGQGAIYVLTYTGGANQWTQQAKVTPTIPISGEYFGRTLNINSDGTRIIAGVDTGNSATQAVYVLQRISTTWSQLYKIQVLNQSQYFGQGINSVAIAGTNFAIGDFGQNGGGGSLSGVVDYFSL
jgi:hypothetical protein